MKKLITLTLIALTSLTINAQDANNDATWEETIGFIKKNIKYLGEDGSEEEVVVTSNNLKFKKYFNCCKTVNYVVDLKKIKLATENYSSLTIYTVGDNIDRYFEDWNNVSSYANRQKWKNEYSNVDIKASDDEYRPRLAKAFEHLAYLATKKREEARKAYGSKF